MKIVLFILLFSVPSCTSERDRPLSISNQTMVNIDSIKISSDVGQLSIKGLKIGKTTTDFFKVSKGSSRGGSFYILIYTRDTVVGKPFGYFGNSGDIPEKLNIKIGQGFNIHFNE